MYKETSTVFGHPLHQKGIEHPTRWLQVCVFAGQSDAQWVSILPRWWRFLAYEAGRVSLRMPAGLWFKSPLCWNLDFVFSGWTWVSRSPGSDQMGGRFPFWPFHTTIFIGADATTAHRLILASRCEFFRAMFTGNLKTTSPSRWCV